MTIRPLLTLALLVALPPVGRSAPAATESSAPPKPAAPAGIAALAELKPGLPAKAVRKLLGEPREVRPMKAPDGKAEVWVYVRELGTHIARIEFPGPEIITYVISGDGKPIEQKTAGPSRYENVQHVTEERVEVLMFNDQYVVHKTSRNERQLH